MNLSSPLLFLLVSLPALLMLTGFAFALLSHRSVSTRWAFVRLLSVLAAGITLANLGLLLFSGQDLFAAASQVSPLIGLTLTAAWIASLVQLLGTVILVFSERYLQGEPRQKAYIAGVAAVLGNVQLLLVADNWWLLIAAWSLTGMALDGLLRFYPERPFAILAAHKKKLSDRLADILLVLAAGLAHVEVGSSSISAFLQFVHANGSDVFIHFIAVLVVLAAAIRLALLPLHGWLIQVMEAPTPVSALLHAGVVNLGGYVLIKFAPLLESSDVARWTLVTLGLFSAFVAGFVMLTRVSIKVRLAWSTLAQMGFMAVECGLGLYALAMLHLIGHSLYKAHAFLVAGNTVNISRAKELRQPASATATWSLVCAPVFASLVVLSGVHMLTSASGVSWPWWWSAVLALAWAPLFWVKSSITDGPRLALLLVRAALIAMVLTVIAWAAHHVPLGVHSTDAAPGVGLALGVMLLIYLGLAVLQSGSLHPAVEQARRLGYAGLYLDDWYTRMVMVAFPPALGPKTPSP
ncbi:MAG: NADH-quinone oxidoreductase subunit L [Betaproteobacteria bacterium]|nr:NADH-quinone oxidoreductase subunit L [Betaproteobacteria bacterium]